MSSIAMPAGLRERVTALVEETIAGTPVFVVDIVVRGRTGARLVEVFLDSDEVLGVDHLASISRELALLLDAGDVLDGSYRLNVSTPGLDRPLVARQFPRNVGRTLRVLFSGAGDAGPVSLPAVEGILVAADTERVVIRDPAGLERQVPVRSIQEAKVVLPW